MKKRILLAVVLAFVSMLLLFTMDGLSQHRDLYLSHFFLFLATTTLTYVCWIAALIDSVLYFISRVYSIFWGVFIPVYTILNLAVFIWLAGFKDFKTVISNLGVRLHIITIAIMIVLSIVHWAKNANKQNWRELL